MQNGFHLHAHVAPSKARACSFVLGGERRGEDTRERKDFQLPLAHLALASEPSVVRFDQEADQSARLSLSLQI